MTTEDKVKVIVGKVLGVAPEQIRVDASLKDDLGATSLDRYSILMEVEEVFALELDEFPEEVLEEKIATVADMVTFLHEQGL